jgi:hypothetical protein
VRPAGKGHRAKEKKPSNLREQTGGHADDVSPRPPFGFSSVLLVRSRWGPLTVRVLLGRVRDHHQPAPAAARSALGLLE